MNTNKDAEKSSFMSYIENDKTNIINADSSNSTEADLN